MNIKVYIVTYNNNVALHNCLRSIEQSNIPLFVNLKINIINNHSNIDIHSPIKYTLLNNVLRPDFSTGHLARSWNQAIINGFKDLNKPDCDILVTCQNDSIFHSGWLSKLIEAHKQYSFITASWGDAFCSYTPDSIKKIGLWDERFCNVEYQEADYFTRALLFNKANSSINDFHHSRALNPILSDSQDNSIIIRDFNNHHMRTNYVTQSNYLLAFIRAKYDRDPIQGWTDDFIKSPPRLINKMYILYPYFEKDIEIISNNYNTY